MATDEVAIIVLRSTKIDPGYVRFSIEHGIEVATLSAQDFRTAMRERDMLRAEREVWGNIAQERNDLRAETERLRATMWEAIRLCAAGQTDDAADMLQQALDT